MFIPFTITVEDSLPFMIVLGVSPSGHVAVRLVGGESRSACISDACEELKAADPACRLVLFREDHRPKYRMCGPSPDRYGEGWYVGGRVRNQPVLIRAARIEDHHPPMVRTGTVVDTGEVVHDVAAMQVFDTDLDEARAAFASSSKWMPWPRDPYEPLGPGMLLATGAVVPPWPRDAAAVPRPLSGSGTGRAGPKRLRTFWSRFATRHHPAGR